MKCHTFGRNRSLGRGLHKVLHNYTCTKQHQLWERRPTLFGLKQTGLWCSTLADSRGGNLGEVALVGLSAPHFTGGAWALAWMWASTYTICPPLQEYRVRWAGRCTLQAVAWGPHTRFLGLFRRDLNPAPALETFEVWGRQEGSPWHPRPGASEQVPLTQVDPCNVSWNRRRWLPSPQSPEDSRWAGAVWCRAVPAIIVSCFEGEVFGTPMQVIYVYPRFGTCSFCVTGSRGLVRWFPSPQPQ